MGKLSLEAVKCLASGHTRLQNQASRARVSLEFTLISPKRLLCGEALMPLVMGEHQRAGRLPRTIARASLREHVIS